MACFADINVSQGSVATYARCDGRWDFWYPFNCKFTKESSSEKKILNRLRIDRIMIASLWPRFWPILYTIFFLSEYIVSFRRSGSPPVFLTDPVATWGNKEEAPLAAFCMHFWLGIPPKSLDSKYWLQQQEFWKRACDFIDAHTGSLNEISVETSRILHCCYRRTKSPATSCNSKATWTWGFLRYANAQTDIQSTDTHADRSISHCHERSNKMVIKHS